MADLNNNMEDGLADGHVEATFTTQSQALPSSHGGGTSKGYHMGH